jgi:DegV family protein with EDD domain
MIRIVTDSSSDISPHLAAQLGITVIPIRISFGRNVYYDGVDIDRSDFHRYLARGMGQPTVEPPQLEEFQNVYGRLLKSTEQILSIHVSSGLNQTVQVAQEATKAFLGRNKITVVDSQMISWGLELLVTVAAEAAQRGAPVEEIVRLIRGVIPHIYMVFFVESLDYVERHGRLDRNRKLADHLPGLRPLLIMEDGEITSMERVRSRGKSTDRLFEFVTEFARFDRATILQGRLSDGAQLLFEHLIDAFPEKRLDIKPYGLALATHLGPDALGVGVYEGI